MTKRYSPEPLDTRMVKLPKVTVPLNPGPPQIITPGTVLPAGSPVDSWHSSANCKFSRHEVRHSKHAATASSHASPVRSSSQGVKASSHSGHSPKQSKQGSVAGYGISSATSLGPITF